MDDLQVFERLVRVESTQDTHDKDIRELRSDYKTILTTFQAMDKRIDSLSYETKSGFEKITTCMEGFTKRMENLTTDVDQEITKGKIDIMKDVIRPFVISLISFSAVSGIVLYLVENYAK